MLQSGGGGSSGGASHLSRSSHGGSSSSSSRNNNNINNNDFAHLLNHSNHSSSGGGGSSSSHHNNSHHHHHNHNHHNSSASTSKGGSSNSNDVAPLDIKQKKSLPPNGKKTKGRVKIKMEFIDNKLRRYTTFSKRKTGIMKKAYELSTLTGTQVMLLVASETGHVYTFATRKLQPMITSEAGKALIQTCLNSPDPPNSGSDTQRMSASGYEETELTYAADDPDGEGEMEDESDEDDDV